VFAGTLEPKTGIIQWLRGFPRGREKLRPRRARSPRLFLTHRYSVKLRPGAVGFGWIDSDWVGWLPKLCQPVTRELMCALRRPWVGEEGKFRAPTLRPSSRKAERALTPRGWTRTLAIHQLRGAPFAAGSQQLFLKQPPSRPMLKIVPPPHKRAPAHSVRHCSFKFAYFGKKFTRKTERDLDRRNPGHCPCEARIDYRETDWQSLGSNPTKSDLQRGGDSLSPLRARSVKPSQSSLTGAESKPIRVNPT
jgi:hypothetical protein